MASSENSIVCQLCASDGEKMPDCPYCELLNEYRCDWPDNMTRLEKGNASEAYSRGIKEARMFE